MTLITNFPAARKQKIIRVVISRYLSVLCLGGRKNSFASSIFTSIQKSSGRKEGMPTQGQWVSSAEGKIGKGVLKANLFKYTIHLSEVYTFGEFVLTFTKVQQ